MRQFVSLAKMQGILTPHRFELLSSETKKPLKTNVSGRKTLIYAMSAHHILIVGVCFQLPGAEQENIVGSSSDEIGFTTLERELEMNGHGNRTIHVLKVSFLVCIYKSAFVQRWKDAIKKCPA